MNKDLLLEKLDNATDRAAKSAIQRAIPIKFDKKTVLVGNTIINKNKNGLYDIVSPDKRIIYKDIVVFDVATIIAQRHATKEFRAIEKVIDLENKYTKYCSDMLHYLNCMKSARSKKDYDTLSILEDKFQIADLRAKKLKAEISLFKRLR